MLDSLLQDVFARNHHTHVDHFVVVTSQDNSDDILADVMNIAFHGGHQDLAASRLGLRTCGDLLLFHEW